MASSLESKTVRPGSLGAYSYYHSARRPDHAPQPYISSARHRLIPRKLLVVLLVVAAAAVVPLVRGIGGVKPAADVSRASQSQSSKSSPSGPSAAAATVAAPSKAANKCAGNSLNKLVLVSISQRKLWACSGDSTVYTSPVITGNTNYEATLTPAGTYHIYQKHTDTVLTGTDITGSWKDPVSYWMPFLSNQYGVYGFHDATWRSPNEFGKVSPSSSDASHGCVELPLATAKWIYGWAPVGTTVTIKN